MRVCGGAAFRKEAGIERLFDVRAAAVAAPTPDVLFDVRRHQPDLVRPAAGLTK
jgi:hypothetical protein